MNFLDKLERKFGRFAIPNLMLYLMFGQGIVFIASLINPSLLYNFVFSWPLILQGEIWRLVTFIFMPASNSVIWFMLIVVIYYSIGSQLERAWGTFHFNFYYFISVISTVIVCILFGISGNIATYINMSLFLSYATLVPEATFYFYFIIPVKAKYMIYFYFVILGLDVLSYGITRFFLIVASLTGYIIFFVIPMLSGRRMRPKRTGSYDNAVYHQQNRRKEQAKDMPKGKAGVTKLAFHKCEVCGKTEVDAPDMEFRYCSTCGKEFCIEHLKSHEH
ncbi:MAG: hypothetical protein ATN33_00840 [Epulopiscium sp. Nele67-Bin001]|nr:MAG: hypothetical protein BEN18_07175 [Epulopiscium sp. Nuni2H_MBin001]OON91572.1 MAG: hypothetical protein ATN33_00840 [Epulopiscium sp. Nele67-Bin001]